MKNFTKEAIMTVHRVWTKIQCWCLRVVWERFSLGLGLGSKRETPKQNPVRVQENNSVRIEGEHVVIDETQLEEGKDNLHEGHFEVKKNTMDVAMEDDDDFDL